MAFDAPQTAHIPALCSREALKARFEAGELTDEEYGDAIVHQLEQEDAERSYQALEHMGLADTRPSRTRVYVRSAL